MSTDLPFSFPQYRIEESTLRESHQVIKARNELLHKISRESKIIPKKSTSVNKVFSLEQTQRVAKITLPPNFLHARSIVRKHTFEPVETVQQSTKIVSSIVKKEPLVAESKPITLGASNFELFKPEVGVTIIEGKKSKNGGSNFLDKYGQHSVYDYKVQVAK